MTTGIRMLAAIALAWAMSHGATYYISSSTGDDGHSETQAQSQSTPWASMVNLETLSLQAGDSVLFKTGDTLRGELDVGASGTAQAPIVFGSYGNLAKPVISGCEVVVGPWTSVGGGHYTADIAGPAHQLFLEGEPMTLARYPNEGYLDVDAVADVRLSFSDSSLSGAANWTGASLHVRTQPWSLDARVVTLYAGGSFTLDRNTNYDISVGNAYFLNNHLAALDSAGEWYFDSAAGTLHLYTPDGATPQGRLVEVTTMDVGVRVNSRSNVCVSGLVAFGHYGAGILLSGNSSDITLENCDALYANGVGIDANSGGEGIRIEGCSSIGANYYGMRFRAANSVMTRNTIRKVGMIGRLGKEGLSGGCCQARGLQLSGSGNECSYNAIDSIGYNGLGFGGENQLIHRNIIKYWCLTTYDGSAIYTWNANYTDVGAAGTVISENVVEGGIGPGGGVVRAGWWSNGIYLDDRTHDITVEANTVSGAYHGIYFHNTKRHVARDNVVFNCSDYSIYFKEDDNGAAGEMIDNVVVGNQVFALSDRYQCVRANGDFNHFDVGRLDSNQYWNPYNAFSVHVSHKPGYPGDNTTQTDLLTLSDWQSFSGDDLHSGANPDMWLSYEVTDTLSTNMIANGTFDSTADNWGCWPCPPGGVAWDQHDSLDGGCAAISLSYDDSVSYALAQSSRFAITESRTYLLSFSVIAPQTMAAKAIVRFAHSPYSTNGLSASFVADSTRRDYQFAFEGSATDPDCRIDFDHPRGDSIFWLDNVSLYEIATAPGEGLSRVRLVTNETEHAQVFPLEGHLWRDLPGAEYGRGATGVTLEPYRSVILVDLGVDSSGVRTHPSMRRGTPLNLAVATGRHLRVSFTAARGMRGQVDLLSASGRVVVRTPFRTGTGVNVVRFRSPASGVYLVRVSLDHGVSAARRVVVSR